MSPSGHSHDHTGHSHGDMNEHSNMASHETTSQMNHNMEGGHAMMFHLRSDLNLLFEPWDISSTKVLVGSCIAVLFISILYEGLKILRAKLTDRHKTMAKRTDGVQFSGSRQSLWITMCSSHHLSQTVLHIVHVALGYLLMLVVMTYQVYLGISVIIGAGLGYFFFAGFISDTDHHKDESCPNPTPESPGMILKLTNFNDLEKKQHQPENTTSSDLAFCNKGFSTEKSNTDK